MKRCPVCGEKYSETYRSCPFCEEEAALRQGDQIRRGARRGGKRAASRHQQPNLLSPILVVLILVMAALLVYLLFGDKIADKLGLGESSLQQSEEMIEPVEPDPTDTEEETPENTEEEEEAGVMPEGSEEEDPAPVDTDSLPETLTMSYLGTPKKEFTMSVGDAPIPLTASGGNGSYTWSSTDPSVATVSLDGKVSAVAAGRATIVLTDGSAKGTCVVIVRGGSTSAGTSAATSSGEPKLSNTDFTTHVGDPNVQLRVTGTSSAVTWATKNAAVATVSDSGVVKAVAAGTTTVTATVDGKTLECIVRVTS